MNDNKQNLKTLIDFVNDIANQNGNEWFKKELINSLISHEHSSSELKEIYEYCIKIILKDQANKFYSDFKLLTIKTKLIDDFIRMEQFRRDDNFEDFCLALFQQIEGIVNELSNADVVNYLKKEYRTSSHKVKNKATGTYEQKKVYQLIFHTSLTETDVQNKLNKPMSEWDFTERYKSVLFYYYFNKKIFNYYDFQLIFMLGHELYQSRNLNHRGGKISDNQKRTIDKVLSNSHRYYFKFLGYLEDFTTKINETII
jgi:hypothetical protein